MSENTTPSDSTLAITARNVRQTLRSVLKDLSSTQFAEKLLKGPIGGCVDIVDTYHTFIDFHDMLSSEDLRPFARVNEAVWLPLKRLRKVLDSLIDVQTSKPDREIIESADWPIVQALAKEALDALIPVQP